MLLTANDHALSERVEQVIPLLGRKRLNAAHPRTQLTSLMHAALLGNEALITALVDAGADVNQRAEADKVSKKRPKNLKRLLV